MPKRTVKTNPTTMISGRNWIAARGQLPKKQALTQVPLPHLVVGHLVLFESVFFRLKRGFRAQQSRLNQLACNTFVCDPFMYWKDGGILKGSRC